MTWWQEDGDDDDFVDMVIADMDFQQPSGTENIMRLPNPQSATESAAVSVIAEVYWELSPPAIKMSSKWKCMQWWSMKLPTIQMG